MHLFAQLYRELDRTTRTVEKVQALERYFAAADARDAAWALYFLTGRKIKRAINSRLLREWLSAEAGLPGWIIDESYDAVGDLAETLALLLPSRFEPQAMPVQTAVNTGLLFSQEELLESRRPASWSRGRENAGGKGSELSSVGNATPLPADSANPRAERGVAMAAPATETAAPPLHRLVEDRIVPLPYLSAEAQRPLVVRTWHELDAEQRYLFHKLLLGEFRVGVARTLVARALANVAGVPPEIMAHRLMGNWEPTAEDYRHLLEPSLQKSDPGQPYPFFLAHPIEAAPQDLGPLDEWQAEWKWDGIRAQLIRRQGEVLVWSRGEELVTDRFPEIAAVGHALPDGVVLDGEILAWRDDRPLLFAALQRRIGRKTVGAKVLAEAPVVFMAYDLLELEGVDLRAAPLVERRAKLEALARGLAPAAARALRLSPLVEVATWDELIVLHREARQRNVEGIMLKRRNSAYGVGRPKGDWWKWKVDPLTIDAVLVYAQPGHGRRASLFTDYTFGVWDQGELVPVAKAYSGLTDAEIRQVDAFIRHNTLERHGPVRIVRPELVFELHFEAIQQSTRHRSGLAVRFPRIGHWRHDKKPEEADTLQTLRALAVRSTTGGVLVRAAQVVNDESRNSNAKPMR